MQLELPTISLRGDPASSPEMNDHQGCLEKALQLAVAENAPPPREYYRTTSRTITRRGLMWLGQTCNLRCHFCYFLDRIENASHPEHRFMPLSKAVQICNTLVDVYGNNAIDIQGGEPTLYPHILDLVRHCREIGLHPTLITNAQKLADYDFVVALRDAGIRDFLVSVQGLGPVYDTIVRRPGAHAKQMAALKNLRVAGIPFRFNVVMSKLAMPQLPLIAELAVKTGAHAVNYLAFNPYDDQAAGKRSDCNVPRYSEIRQPLVRSLELLREHDIEANVRYLPLCSVPDVYLPNMYNFQQLPYDHHENEFGSWRWTQLSQQRTHDDRLTTPPLLGNPLNWFTKKIYGLFYILNRDSVGRKIQARLDNFIIKILSGVGLRGNVDSHYRSDARERAKIDLGYVFGKACGTCDLKSICDGFHGDYAEFFGTDEARPAVGLVRIDDPTHFIRKQNKIVQDEDVGWANTNDPVSS